MATEGRGVLRASIFGVELGLFRVLYRGLAASAASRWRMTCRPISSATTHPTPSDGSRPASPPSDMTPLPGRIRPKAEDVDAPAELRPLAAE